MTAARETLPPVIVAELIMDERHARPTPAPRPCGCPSAGVVAVDELAHARWHKLVAEQLAQPDRPRPQPTRVINQQRRRSRPVSGRS